MLTFEEQMEQTSASGEETMSSQFLRYCIMDVILTFRLSIMPEEILYSAVEFD